VAPTQLPDRLAERILSFPEYRMGVHRVAFVMSDGSTIDNVLVAWGREVIRVGGVEDVHVNVNNVLDVVDRSKP